MRLVDDDGDWTEIPSWLADVLMVIATVYKQDLATRDERIRELEGDIGFYTGELARAPW